MQSRDLSIFNTPVPASPTATKAAKLRQKLQEYIATKAMPPSLARYALNTCKTKAAVDRLASTFARGCHLTGIPFTDRHTRNAKPDPHAAVLRKDGTMVSYAIWVFSHEGEVTDQVLVNCARAIARFADTTPISPASTTPTQELGYGHTPNTDMGGDGFDISDAGDPLGLGQPAGDGPSVLTWDFTRQAMVRTAA